MWQSREQNGGENNTVFQKFRLTICANVWVKMQQNTSTLGGYMWTHIHEANLNYFCTAEENSGFWGPFPLGSGNAQLM